MTRKGAVTCVMGVVLAFAPPFLRADSAQPTNASQTNLPVRLTLAEAKQTAFLHNWDLLSAKSGIDSAVAQLIVTREFPNPTLNYSTSTIGTHNEATIEGNGIWHRSYDTVVAVSQLIEIAGKRHDRQASARAGIRGAKARFYDAHRTLDQGMTKAYVTALLAEVNVKILGESARFLTREADIGQARFKAGDLSDSDLKQIQINAEQFELQETAAEATAAQARITLEILMGVRHPAGNWVPANTLEQMDAMPPPAPQVAAYTARPDVLAAESDLRSGEFNLKLQKALRIPDPTFSIQYEHDPMPPGPPTDDTFGFGISFPLPFWNLNGGNIKAAQAAIDQYQFALEKVRAQASSDVANAQVEYREAYDRWQRYKNLIVPQSAKSREAISFAFEKGAATLVDLLEAQRTDNAVRLSDAQAMSDTASAVADVIAAQTVLSKYELEARK